MPKKPIEERDPWAMQFASAIRKWLKNHNIKGRELAERLEISHYSWAHAVAGSAITKTEYYARIFCFTGVTAADPRTIPPRATFVGLIQRAMTHEEWGAWYEQYHHLYTPGVEEDEEEKRVNPVTEPAEEQGQGYEYDDEDIALAQIAAKLTGLLRSGLSSEELTLEILNKHGRRLGELYQILGIYNMEPSDRAVAKTAYRRYGK
jgi:hypothetical protein